MIIVPQEKMLKMGSNSNFKSVWDRAHIRPRINGYDMQSESVQKLIHSTNLHFDVIINEEFFADSFLMFAHKFKSPIVTICKCDLQFRLIWLTEF